MVNFGLLAAGRIGAIHAANTARHSVARLISVYDTNAAAAEAIARNTGAQVAPSVESVLQDKEVDAVLIASPTGTHVDLITAAALAGKSIFCEKPIDLDIQRVMDCKKAIAGSGVAVQIGFNRRYDRSHRDVRNAVHAGDIGALELLMITSRDSAPAPLAYLEVSGGLFRDMTIHDFDMARFILGADPIVELYATGSVLIEPALERFGDVDTAMVVMRAASGALVHINNSRRTVYGYDQRNEAFGAKGMVSSDNVRASTLVRYGATGTDSKDPLLDFFLERYAQAYFDELDDFIDVVTERRKPQVDFEDGRLALVLADAAAQSLRSGRAVRVNYG